MSEDKIECSELEMAKLEYDDLKKRIEKLENEFEKQLYIDDIKKFKKAIGSIKKIPNIQKEISELRHDFNSHASLIIELKEYLKSIESDWGILHSELKRRLDNND